ncbi:hypothetical protein QWJ34_26175 [Saccharibacillus sp. CPCC 101409]|uniref:hypothetical protein n=1 Tax=Saccharibacillus sp. CPCC 101409 TaxID=3058041 RepID=UPI00267251A7|nr:hypothetical protein [Saccharibacillus sp. CPCC 101409]MDO3413266.1 hypothetical protein [Saccharibacillus sp. CPCC 101409]
MSGELHDLFAEVYDEVKAVLDETEGMSHPLVVLFRTSLEDERGAFERLLPALEREKPELESFKKDCSIVYLNDEIAESAFRAWLRAVDWMDHADSEEASKLENRFPGMKDTLKKAAAKMEDIYGAAKIKYVVPALYQPQTGGVQ